MTLSEPFDVVIIGGGPAGLAAALTLGRARKRVLVCDAGPRRNAAAIHIHNFVTRDGTPPGDFRAIAREQLARYPDVTLRDVGVTAIDGARGAFEVTLTEGAVTARRVLVCTGMVDELLPIDGFRELWGRSIFQCPYCHGWEIQDARWGYLARAEDAAHLQLFALMARGWTRDLVVFASFGVPTETRRALELAGVGLEATPIARLVSDASGLTAVALTSGVHVARDALFVHPPQRQVALVQALGLALDDAGFVAVDPMKRETSIPGIYAAGDLTTRMQAAIGAAAAGTQAAAMINAELTMERVLAGAL